MDYKEKYEQALSRARQFSEKPLLEDSAGIVEYIFPELAESEDEKIRKALMRYFTLSDEHAYSEACGVSYRDIVVWLEKQGEQKSAIIIQKFRVGDEIKTNNEESLTITKIDEKGYWSDDLFICSFEDSAKWELVEQKPAWSEEDEAILDGVLTFIPDKEQKDWLKSLKDRVQPKQEWSEEDIEMLNSTISFVEHSAFTTIGKGKNNVISWLKSLKERGQKKQQH